MIKHIDSAIKVFIVLLVGASLLSSCKDDIAFAAENKTTIDTMYLNRKHVMEDEIDSLCSVRNDAFYKQAVDSIMAVRISEIELRLNSLKTKSAVR